MQKCAHGDNWNLCFQTAQQNQKFAEECLVNMEESILPYVRKFSEQEEDAKDICQELLIALSRCFYHYQNKGDKGKAYVKTIAHNIVKKYFQKKKKIARIEGESRENFSCDGVESLEKVDAVRHCLGQLPGRYENVISLRLIEGKEAQTIERTHKIAVRTQYHYLKMGMELLKKCLEKQGLRQD